MNSVLPELNYKKETETIVSFLRKTFVEQKISKAVVGVSGGIDSAVSLFLITKALGPENVFAIHMPYTNDHEEDFKLIIKSVNIPDKNVKIIPIKSIVDQTAKDLEIQTDTQTDKIRFGNIAARTRMITLFDTAKREGALAVGTENKSEDLLSYFTRFGDQASDIEPIQHLYKTRVFELAKHLGIPEKIINKQPTAGLWAGQTDEKEFGFSYEEADQVLYLYFEKKQGVEQIVAQGFKNAEKIVAWVKKNEFKHQTPYKL